MIVTYHSADLAGNAHLESRAQNGRLQRQLAFRPQKRGAGGKRKVPCLGRRKGDGKRKVGKDP